MRFAKSRHEDGEHDILRMSGTLKSWARRPTLQTPPVACQNAIAFPHDANASNYTSIEMSLVLSPAKEQT